eukprot:GDKH01029068.1.p1 GENE.GDKH01029068.1~~GDKH01029068.1.p1  ORF type:complete len:194 (-),score=4.55 GDKH01029068.1:77-658(-)
MPPVNYKPPKPVQLRAPKGTPVRLSSPDTMLGKTIVATMPHRISQNQLENMRRNIRHHVGKKAEINMNVHATYGVTAKPHGCKMGQGRGPIVKYVARVAAGRALFNLPAVNPLADFGPLRPNFMALKKWTAALPVTVQVRSQNNIFEVDSFHVLQKAKHDAEQHVREESRNYWLNRKARLCGVVPDSGLPSSA